MTEEFKERHVHSGKSSKAYLDADKVIKEIGLKSGDSFLDIGSGEGYFSIAASRIVGNKGKVYALDSYEESIKKLREQVQQEQISNLEAVAADVTQKIPLTNGIVDVCLMANVLHGFANEKELSGAMNEIARVMKLGGTFAVVDFKKIDGPPGPPISIRLAPDEVIKKLSKYGFRETRVADLGPYHYAVMFSKFSS
ncbi:MAG TPA: class I SAM-dependent methyltransferase [Dehalococcoidia bacterium]|nr:class I SAM-dependent methyltransferase [Dehalococcoidia bacterium]